MDCGALQTGSPAGDLEWTIDSQTLLKDLIARTNDVQQRFIRSLVEIRQKIFPNAQGLAAIDLDWVKQRSPSCNTLQLDLLSRILVYEGGASDTVIPDGPSPVSTTGFAQNVKELISFFQQETLGSIKPIDVRGLAPSSAGLYYALHLTEKKPLVCYQTSGPDNIVAFLALGGGLRDVTRAGTSKDIEGPLERLRGTVGKIYAQLRYPCSQDQQAPLRPAALKVFESSLRFIRRSHPEAKLIAWCWSAAGNLVACSQERANAYIHSYSVLSMQNHLTDKGTQQRGLGLNATEEQKLQASAEKCVSETQWPEFYYLYHSQKDQKVPVAGVIAFAESLVGKGALVCMFLDVEGGHGDGTEKHHKGLMPFIGVATSNSVPGPQRIDFTKVREHVAKGEVVMVRNYN